MFSSTVDQLIKTLGRDTLFPVPSIETSDNIGPLCLVITEPTRYWLFWKKYKHYTTEFALKDILVGGGEDLKVEETTRKITTYNRSTKLSLKGKFGVQLCRELLDVDLKASDYVTVNSQLGDLEKVEVDLPSLLSALKDRKIDLKSRRIESLANQSNKILGIVTGVIRLMNDAKLDCKTDLDISAEADGKHLSNMAGGEATGEADDDKSRSITLVKGTALAFTMLHLLISTEDGSFKVILNHGSTKGGFTPQRITELDDVDGLSSSFTVLGATDCETQMFKGLMDLDDTRKEDFRIIIKRIMELPKLVLPISDLLQRAETFIDAGIRRSTNLTTLNEKIGTEDDELMPLLNFTGFHTETNGAVEYPLECSDMFEVCQLLMSLLEELEDDEIHALADCLDNSSTARLLLQILRKTECSGGESVALSAEERSILSTDPAKKLVEALKMTVDDDTMTFSRDNIGIKACRLILHAFYGTN
ncbi:pejvakin-like isoform X2 [Gigantopelta aegis]|uniref:pejvakin-like isoform X2 n=1 Tax=Gigantopelta aegis TaxID=1735272 RepID=UPI001B88A67E|nr:pejvakin-like isoform X2 [Gigantopelta aegis]